MLVLNWEYLLEPSLITKRCYRRCYLSYLCSYAEKTIYSTRSLIMNQHPEY